MAQRETMSRQSLPAPRSPSAPTSLAAAQAHAAREWAMVRGRLATVTPRAVGRGAVVIGSLAAVGLLAQATWPALLPFVVGGLIAYRAAARGRCA